MPGAVVMQYLWAPAVAQRNATLLMELGELVVIAPFVDESLVVKLGESGNASLFRELLVFEVHAVARDVVQVHGRKEKVERLVVVLLIEISIFVLEADVKNAFGSWFSETIDLLIHVRLV